MTRLTLAATVFIMAGITAALGSVAWTLTMELTTLGGWGPFALLTLTPLATFGLGLLVSPIYDDSED